MTHVRELARRNEERESERYPSPSARGLPKEQPLEGRRPASSRSRIEIRAVTQLRNGLAGFCRPPVTCSRPMINLRVPTHLFPRLPAFPRVSRGCACRLADSCAIKVGGVRRIVSYQGTGESQISCRLLISQPFSRAEIRLGR